MEANVLTPEVAKSVAYLCFGIMFIGLIAVFHNRARLKRGIGGRAIQSLAVILIVPSIIVLTVLGIFGSDTAAALLGALIGYVLSGLSDFEKEKTKRNADKSEEKEA